LRKLEVDLVELQAVRAASPVLNMDEGLVVKGVCAHVPGTEDPILAGVDLVAKPGEAVVISGRTGSGKSTLGQLIIGNSKPSAGEATFGGVNLARADREAVGPLVGYLPQSVGLFAGTVRDNIARMGDASLDDVISAARLAGVNRTIVAMPAQYETEVGEAGALLSGGQRQGVGLARAVYGGPKLVVLDEPDANLDSRGRRALRRTVRRLKRQRAVVVFVTHRSEEFRDIGPVFELKNGVLTEKYPAVSIDDKPADQVAQPKQDEASVVRLDTRLTNG
jgi:ATP-binding cassette subfamily C protein/ATP-binding cassette subfamily C exporter for protease/lipase/ATP-binding cassette subfamily C protein EexD